MVDSRLNHHTLNGLDLKLVKSNDCFEIFSAINSSPSHFRFLWDWPLPYRLKDAKQFVSKAIKEQKVGDGYHYTIWRDSVFCGVVGVYDINKRHSRASLGIWLAPYCVGSGMGTLVFTHMRKVSFRLLGVKKLISTCVSLNRPSLIMLRRSGFSLEAKLKNHAKIGKRWASLLIFSAWSH